MTNSAAATIVGAEVIVAYTGSGRSITMRVYTTADTMISRWAVATIATTMTWSDVVLAAWSSVVFDAYTASILHGGVGATINTLVVMRTSTAVFALAVT